MAPTRDTTVTPEREENGGPPEASAPQPERSGRDSLVGKLRRVIFSWPAAVALAAVAGLAIGYLVFVHESTSKDPLLPGEYLYLDNNRVDAYLGQIDYGLTTKERRTRTTSRRAEASATAGTLLEVGGSVQDDQFVERVVTPAAADRFYQLHQRLEGYGDDDFPEFDATERMGQEPATDIQAGDFVTIANARLQLPTYSLPLPGAAYATRSLAPEQDQVRYHSLSHLLSTDTRSVNRYLRMLGPDPRIPAVVKAKGERGQTLTVMVPLQFQKLSNAPALMSGRLTVVGKVIRLVTGDPYYDVESELTFAHALRAAPRSVLDTLEIERGKARDTIRRTATVEPPGLVVIPIAIFH